MYVTDADQNRSKVYSNAADKLYGNGRTYMTTLFSLRKLGGLHQRTGWVQWRDEMVRENDPTYRICRGGDGPRKGENESDFAGIMLE